MTAHLIQLWQSAAPFAAMIAKGLLIAFAFSVPIALLVGRWLKNCGGE